MGDKSKIQWTEATWNVTYGCTRVSKGCDNCYAVGVTRRLAGSLPVAQGLVGRGHFNGEVRLLPERLDQPLRWKKPRRIFVNSLSDLFHKDVPDPYIANVFAVMAEARQHTFQVLTKRPERAAALLGSENFWTTVLLHGMEQWWGLESLAMLDVGVGYPLTNVWLGTSVEDQEAADERIPHLLRAPAAVRFLSCEPLLEEVELKPAWLHSHMGRLHVGPGHYPGPGVDWVIIGGESGPRARRCDVDWIRALVTQCQAAGVSAFVKQLGARPIGEPPAPPPGSGYAPGESPGMKWQLLLRDKKGGDPAEWPQDLRVREYPVAYATQGQ